MGIVKAVALALACAAPQDVAPELAEIRKDLRAAAALDAAKDVEAADRAFGEAEIRLVRWAGAAGLSLRDPGLAEDVKALAEGQGRVDALLKAGLPPPALGLDPFYKKHIELRGLPIVSSEKVPAAALVRARAIVRRMTSKRPELLAELVKRKVRVAILAKTELTTDLPEHATLTPKDYWDKRARGLGATPSRPAVSGAEENLLGYPEDRYRGESIFLHEFAHTIHTMAMEALEPGFDAALRELYEAAKKKGLWARTYALEDHKEYFAEGVQSWFDTNRQADPPDGIHNHVDTRPELEAYDPDLAAFIRKVFP
jgi:hypothetical protein